jgi:hypothetical protein
VWAGAVETAKLELISTQQLQTFLASDDAVSQRSIEDAASCGSEGVLARDAATGLFEIIDDFDIQAVLDGNAKDAAKRHRQADVTLETVDTASTPTAEELSLVSTQMLRKVLGTGDSNDGNDDEVSVQDDSGGFDPYNSG